jgi:hypothetical protein
MIEARDYAAAAAAVENTMGRLDRLHDLTAFERRDKAGRLLRLLMHALGDEQARRERVAHAPGPAIRSHAIWVPHGPDGYLLECLDALGFRRVLFALDLPPQYDAALWVANEVFDRLDDWDETGTRFVVFAAADLPPFDRAPSFVQRRTLGWAADDLRGLIDHRYKIARGRYRRPDERFHDPADLTRLIEHSKVDESDDSHNPRRFNQLWHAADTDPSQPITSERVDRAIVIVQARTK